MGLDEFLNTYTGELIDFDKYYGAQCVDLMRQYIKDVYSGVNPASVVGAKDFAKMQLEGFSRLNKRRKIYTGDILIYGATTNNQYGHTAIAIGTCTNGDILVFGQDGFAQDGAKFSLRSKDNLLCIFRHNN